MKSQFSLQKLDSIYGEIEFAKFIKMNYSTLIDDAYAGIIYACNQCLRQMARSGFSDEGKLKFLQGLYRKYGWYYIRKKYSNLGKIVTFLAMISINLAEMILGFLYRNQLIK